MSRVCEITGKKAMVGNHVSFSNKKNKRTFDVNLMRKKFYVAAEDKWVTLRISAAALKTINKKGIEAVLAEARANGNVAL
ncbi:MAG: 50S ribosomal protein L28 [Schleiferiaceae bacterium]|jgi:large subunit ribosomal protein L28|nr:50S ribosomal protein L28 [Bacteroidota bacterium]